jgi:hypothetical protein
MEIVPLNLAKLLEKKGFNNKTLFSFNKEQIINPLIVEKYGELSDDGYYELTKDGGGDLDFEYVYIYEYELVMSNSIYVHKDTVKAPFVSEVIQWLRKEKNIHIEINMGFNMFYYKLCSTTEYDKTCGTQVVLKNCEEGYEKYEDCELKCLEYVINNLI